MNDRIYIHEFIDITGHSRADYMHHMTANWSPHAREARGQLCFGVWAVVGSTGRWPQVVNIWEEQGWDGLARSLANETVGRGAQDPKLEKWWARAADFRRGGVDRLLEPAPWMDTIEELCTAGVSGACYAHDLLRVRAGAAAEVLEQVHDRALPLAARHGWKLVGAWTTALVDDDECVLLWAIPTWDAWVAHEGEQRTNPDVVAWRRAARDLIEGRQRILLVDAPLSPFRTGRQPSREDRTEWDD